MSGNFTFECVKEMADVSEFIFLNDQISVVISVLKSTYGKDDKEVNYRFAFHPNCLHNSEYFSYIIEQLQAGFHSTSAKTPSCSILWSSLPHPPSPLWL